MTTITPLHEELGIGQGVYDSLCIEAPAALVVAIKTHDTPNSIKAAAIKSIISKVQPVAIGTVGFIANVAQYQSDVCALIGIMVEQAYNAAVLASNKPLFGKRN